MAVADIAMHSCGNEGPDSKFYSRDRVVRKKKADQNSLDRHSYHEQTEHSRKKACRQSIMKQDGAKRRATISYKSEITVNLPGKRGLVRRRTSVAFDEKTRVMVVPPIRELTDKPESLWFQDSEYALIWHKADILTEMACSSTKNATARRLCLRGLEPSINREFVLEEQHLAWKSVFLEQYQQRVEGDYNEELIAQIYEFASTPSRARALQRAQEDLTEAQKHTRGMRSAFIHHSGMPAKTAA